MRNFYVGRGSELAEVSVIIDMGSKVVWSLNKILVLTHSHENMYRVLAIGNDQQHPATRNLTVPIEFIATSIIALPKVNCRLSPHSISSVFGDKYRSFAAVCLWRHCLPPRSHRRCNLDADESPPKKGLVRYSLGVCMVYLIAIN
ncbi:hypothetical protein PIB30_079825 [Stylosanthes scabra]|uniref:Uncharacterized protein n=1 Tax=Stylosanthes scabra TaxID=79078 RepID=A0ABU6XQ45_9FABA|nr:hypothetical protein [Stylosanthes scabra]